MNIIKIKKASVEEVKSPIDQDNQGILYSVYVVCSYCGKMMDVKEGEKGQISHGVCDECLQREISKIKSKKV